MFNFLSLRNIFEFLTKMNNWLEAAFTSFLFTLILKHCEAKEMHNCNDGMVCVLFISLIVFSSSVTANFLASVWSVIASPNGTAVHFSLFVIMQKTSRGCCLLSPRDSSFSYIKLF